MGRGVGEEGGRGERRGGRDRRGERSRELLLTLRLIRTKGVEYIPRVSSSRGARREASPPKFWIDDRCQKKKKNCVEMFYLCAHHGSTNYLQNVGVVNNYKTPPPPPNKKF